MMKRSRLVVDFDTETQGYDLQDPLSQQGQQDNANETLHGPSIATRGPSTSAVGLPIDVVGMPFGVVGPSELYDGEWY